MKLDVFTQAYIDAALWSSTDENGEPMDQNSDFDLSNFHPDTIKKIQEDCDKFRKEIPLSLEESKLEDSRAGHNFWLNRNGHGSGFWDEYSQNTCDKYEMDQVVANQTCDCPYHACQRLSDFSKSFGSCDLYKGDDGKIYIQ